MAVKFLDGISTPGVSSLGSDDLSITSNSNADIIIDPDGTGAIVLKSNDIKMEGAGTITMAGVRFYEASLAGTNYVGLSAPLSIDSNQMWTLPASDGTSNQALKTNGSGVLGWTDVLSSQNPSVTGVLALKPYGSSGSVGIQIFNQDGDGDNSNNHSVFIKVPGDLAADWSLTLPANDGNAGQFLKTDGSGVTSWASSTSLASADQTLTADRKIILDGNNLLIENAAGTQVGKFFTTGYFQNKGRLLVNGHATSGAHLKLYEATDNGTNSITLNAPTTIGSDVSLTLPDADGSNGQFLKTNGSGVLSFASASGGGSSNSLLIAYGGRSQHSTSYDNRMVICGGIYGPTYYIWSTQIGVTASGGGTVDSTTFTLSASYQHYGAIRVPSDGQVRVDFIARPLNSNSYNKPYVLQLWEFDPTVNTTSGPTCTLRAKGTLTSATATNKMATGTMTSVSDCTAGKYVFVTLGMDAQTLSATAYQYTNINVTLLA